MPTGKTLAMPQELKALGVRIATDDLAQGVPR
jgi:hypothetical protein